MNEAELKAVHGEDVELAPDNSKDEHLSEKDALAQGKAEGLEFVDEFIIMTEGGVEKAIYETWEEAQDKLKGNETIMQRRHTKQ